MKNSYFLLSLFLGLMLISCKDDEVKVSLSEDPGYVVNPLISIQAEDGSGNWIDGVIDQNERTINFDFRILEDQSVVNVKLELDEEWAKAVDPNKTNAVLDLSSGITRIRVNDGADDVEYTIFGKHIQLLQRVDAVCNTEHVTGDFVNGSAYLRFKQNSDFSRVILAPILSDKVEIVSTTPSGSIDENGNLIVNLVNNLTITVKDNITNMTKDYLVSAVNGIINAGDNWRNVTADLKNQYAGIVIPDFMQIYENNNLHGRNGNKGWLITIPAGKINMKVSWDMSIDKGGWDMPSPAHRTTAIMESNTDYSLFIPGLSGQLWSPTFYCLALNDNQLLSAPHIGYNPATAIKNCPGTLGISAEGKAEISYAEVFDNVLYKFSNGGTNKQVSNGTPWTPVTAVSGYSYPLRGGSVMIGAENKSSYQTFATNEGRHTPIRNAALSGHINGSNPWISDRSIPVVDGVPMSRRAAGITPDGDLVFFVSNRFSNTYNMVKNEKVNWNTPSDGSSLREVAVALQEVGCTDAIVFGESYFAPVVIKDSERGIPLGKTAGRYDWELTGKIKNPDQEGTTQSWMMFK
ncbi:hypothetical protein [Proteiniphilum sp. UBA5431]|jgi:hypothetical protein|uniref:hypothetical protein n=2 Tax=unclassified Proteiniphilum TaxID=2622718 RepID=UPI00257DF758|nr:hypothetical protein [Proteiniphilum sp. UBA5431]